MSKILKASVLENRELSKGYFLLTLNLNHEVNSLPGQFFMLRIGRATDPFLPRPFSFHRHISKKRIQFIYKVVGRVTSNLSMLEKDSVIELTGPLGNGFPLFKEMVESLLVAGGIGIAPLVALAERLEKKSTTFFIGGKTKNDILLKRDLKGITNRLYITTEDSSIGRAGVVTDALIDYLKAHDSPASLPGLAPWPRSLASLCEAGQAAKQGRLRSRAGCEVGRAKLKTVVYACGPRAMLQKVSEIAFKHNINCYVSLEETMACGVGACMGCVVKIRSQKSNPPLPPFTKGGRGGITNSELRTLNSNLIYKRVCKDGPVFMADEVIWE
ncbi:MAG: dihydroorotate dehydrogenase electron transfer subunit [Nitrospirota bacterium]